MLKLIQKSIQNSYQHVISPVFKVVIPISFSVLLFSWQPATALAAPNIPNPGELSRAVQEIENLDAMRSGLAASLEGRTEEPTLQTMQEVCRPVGMRAMQLSQENGWQVKQIAKKYRNPAHAPDNLQSRIALARFEQNPELVGFWDRETIDEQLGTRYYRRINVEATCLVCHGAKENRPQFVKDNYPQDLAYNFHVGDLRGMYSVFIPDNVKQSIQDAVNP
ncbi:MAG: DUF3365 domain-containing protein [Synechococcales cyanobacterium C42_A2020_086]|nr:DUF3365 domain-containing protein [Synechococcales cyanobacterium C42_A2020_086]